MHEVSRQTGRMEGWQAGRQTGTQANRHVRRQGRKLYNSLMAGSFVMNHEQTKRKEKQTKKRVSLRSSAYLSNCHSSETEHPYLISDVVPS